MIAVSQTSAVASALSNRQNSTCARKKHNKHNEGRRNAPVVHGLCSVPLSYSGNVVSRIELQYFLLTLGVAYTIDKTRGNCSILPIQGYSFDALLNSNKNSSDGQSQFVVRMKSPNELFFLDNSAMITYGGQVSNTLSCFRSFSQGKTTATPCLITRPYRKKNCLLK